MGRVVLLGLLCCGLLSAQGDPCADCGDRTRPWHRGSIHKFCGRAADLEALREAHPGVDILACACQHTCDMNADRADETGGRGWDARCQARCSPNNCGCPHVCTIDP